MTKKGPLGKAEKYYIENHLHLSVAELCADLGRAKATVERFIDRLPKKKIKAQQQEAEEPAPEPAEKKETLLYKQFARNDRGSTVMTQNAAEMGDSFRERNVSSKVSRCTTKIR